MNVPDDKVRLLNYTPTVDYMHTPAEYGGGLEALVEVFHQLHCLVSSVSKSPSTFLLMLRIFIPHCFLPSNSFMPAIKFPEFIAVSLC